MKKIIVFSLLAVTLVFCKPNEVKAQKQGDELISKDGYFIIWMYGMPRDLERQNAENVITEKWKIRYNVVEDCIVTQELVDSAQKHNDAVEKLIAAKYGKDWRDRLNKDIDLEYQIEKCVTSLVDTLSYIRKKGAEISRFGNPFCYEYEPISNTTQCMVSVKYLGKIKGGKDTLQWLTYYVLIVDYEKKSVRLIKDNTSEIINPTLKDIIPIEKGNP